MRLEKDTLGSVEVPEDHLWGAQTQRAALNFPIGGDCFRWSRPVIRAFGIVKKCAALANGELGQLPREKVEAIVQAADELAAGRWDAEFPLSIFQSGSGTQSNMNANEVLANRAIQQLGGTGGSKTPIHPNDDVNCSQSSNDVFPTVMHVAAVDQLDERLFPALQALRDALQEKSTAYAAIAMLGRTHLQDAVPVTLGQVIAGWIGQLDIATDALRHSETSLYGLALGGTAVGTGLNAPPQFGALVAQKIAAETGRPFVSAPNKFAALSGHEALVEVSAALRTLAVALFKIANDVRWYVSGPHGGIGELTIPGNEPGSSIMPAKVNPTQCESLLMVAMQVFGNDYTVAFAGSQGNFQLNVAKPVILHNVLESIQLLADGCRSFTERCIRGLAPKEDIMRTHLESSPALVTALAPLIGYEGAAKIAELSEREGIPLRDAALKSGLVTGEQYDKWVQPSEMADPHAWGESLPVQAEVAPEGTTEAAEEDDLIGEASEESFPASDPPSYTPIHGVGRRA